LNEKFSYERRVAFSETDAMRVAHHASYIHFCEEARVAWMRERGLSHTHFPQAKKILAVLHYQVWHLKTCTFDDLLRIELQVRRVGLRIHYQYVIWKDDERIAEAETWHIPVDPQLKPTRHDPELITALEKEVWTETWLSNS
jgi:acyl-CoA thioester hydrolase